ncbi:DinI-like family protein [Salmonella enterica]|nr:DinI-like family protein [Salmonella enterica]
MFVELVYDKRNVEGLEGASEIILAELTKQVHQIFPDAEVRVKPMQASCLNSDANKSDRENLNRWLIKNRFILNHVIYI